MEFISVNEKENKLFNRKEIAIVVKTEITPKESEVLEALSKKFSVPEEAIKILSIKGKFGVKTFRVKANIYHSKQEKDKVEKKSKKEIEAEKKALEEAKKIEAEAKKLAELEASAKTE
jgi:ribosomal protein S24E